MIQSFNCDETKKLHEGEVSTVIPNQIQRVARRKLAMMAAAVELTDLRIPPNNRLEALKGSRKGQHSIRVNDQWRICFKWSTAGPRDVEVVDYH